MKKLDFKIKPEDNANLRELKNSCRIVSVRDEWEAKWRTKCHGASFETWLGSVISPKLTIQYYERRHRAAERFGLEKAGRIDHNALVWLDSKLKPDEETLFFREVDLFLGSTQGPISLSQCKKLYAKTLGVSAKGVSKPPTQARVCRECIQLQERIKELRGKELP